MPSEARACAYRVLRRVFEQDAYADRALHSCASGLGARERALAMHLSYGTIQRIGTLDPAIERLSARELSAIDPPVLAALRLGLYELLYSSSPTAHAVVDDAVELTKRSRSRGHGLVNAVLRRAAREGRAVLGLLEDSTPKTAAIAHSHPAWLAQMWWEQLGSDQARSLMAADNEPAENVLRVNTLLAEPGEIAAALGEQAGSTLLGVRLPEAIVLSKPLDLRASKVWRSGLVMAQSRAAMLVSLVLDPKPGEQVLDLCAAPGGKTTHIAALMQGQGRIVAVERHPGRARELREAVERTRARCVEVQTVDAQAPRPEGESFDRVLLDAPCSGLGTLQGHPDLRWRASERSVRELAALQCKILGAAAEAVRPGGTLVYSTCTISHAENEQQMELFLDAHPEFATEPAGPAASMSGSGPFLTSLPDRDRTAGFFIAKLRRQCG
jgi:16S rRNA (cytosine967-C5)-methyltransferase